MRELRRGELEHRIGGILREGAGHGPRLARIERRCILTVRSENNGVPQPVDVVFSFFSRPENLQVITPFWLAFRILETPEALAAGSLIRYRLRWHWLPIRWTTEITAWNRPHGSVDREVAGPYALWNHEHWFISHDGGTTMRDRVTYALPFAWRGTSGFLGGSQARCREDFRFLRREHAASVSGLKGCCTNRQGSYTNSESTVWRVVSGAQFLVSQAENTRRGSFSAGFSGRTNSGWRNRFLSSAG